MTNSTMARGLLSPLTRSICRRTFATQMDDELCLMPGQLLCLCTGHNKGSHTGQEASQELLVVAALGGNAKGQL